MKSLLGRMRITCVTVQRGARISRIGSTKLGRSGGSDPDFCTGEVVCKEVLVEVAAWILGKKKILSKKSPYNKRTMESAF